MKFDLTKYEIKKNIILNATYKCIFRQGIAGISMRSIASHLSHKIRYILKPSLVSSLYLSIFLLNRYQFAVMENYPQIRSNDNIMQLQEELTSTENRIGFARQLYNDLVAQYRIKQEVFPNNIFTLKSNGGQ